MKDQHDNPIPDDLVMFPSFRGLNPAEINTVFDATWYKCNGILLISAVAINFLSETDLFDATGINPLKYSIFCIDERLKRGNLNDNFYTA